MPGMPDRITPTLVGLLDVIDRQVLGSAATVISFTGIDTSYRIFEIEALIDDATPTNNNVFLNFNNDSGTNYDYQYIYGSSTTIAGARGTSSTVGQINSGSGEVSNGTIQTTLITIAKPTTGLGAFWVSRSTYFSSAVSGHVVNIVAGRWNNTADLISRIDLTSSSGNFDAGTCAILSGDNH